MRQTALNVFDYGQKEIDYLKKRDKKLGLAIDRIGKIEREINADIFSALISSIVSQQISSKAAETVGKRLCDLLGEIKPQTVEAADVADIQKCGLSMRKAGYIKGIGEAVTRGVIEIAAFSTMSDDEVIKILSSLNGVGVWTAEMLLIFSLGRKDIMSWGDLAIRRGICSLYGHKTLTKDQFDKYKKRYSPYGTVASLYLWELSNQQDVKRI